MKFIKKFIRFIVVGVLVLAGGFWALLYFSGDETTRDLTRQAKYKAKGAVGDLKNMQPASSTSPEAAAQCRQNLKQIETAKRKVGGRIGAAVGSISRDDLLDALGGKMPKCPAGGKYNPRDLGFLPRCSIDNNKNVDKRDDHVILQF